ncbi:hypothetical protein [Hyphomonas jannaschiana]|nr:hypothetical protein [Hyphomonas jannaschiana]
MMRYIGLCSALLIFPAACDDAVGSGYPETTSGAVIESSITEASDTPSEEGAAEESAESTADAGSEETGDTPEERMASLGLSREMDYTCDQSGMSAHVVLYGDEDVAAVIIPGKVNVPLYLDCSPTRIGPECSDGQFTAHINTLEDKAMFSELKDAAPLVCTMAVPEPVPELE